MDFHPQAQEDGLGEGMNELDCTWAECFQALSRAFCEAKADGGRWFRLYSVWNGVFWTISFVSVYVVILIIALLGQLFWAALETRPVWNLSESLSEHLLFTRGAYYAKIRIHPQVQSYPVSVKWTHIESQRSFVQVIGIGLESKTVFSVDDLFPFESDKGDCPSFEEKTLSPGYYKLELFYDKRFVVKGGKADPETNHMPIGSLKKCNPHLNDDILAYIHINTGDVEYLEDGSILEFKIYRGISIPLYHASRLQIGWVYYLSASLSILLLYSLSRIYRKYGHFRRFGYVMMTTILGLLIAYGCTVPSAASLPIFASSIVAIAAPVIVLSYLIVRIVRQRRSIEQIEYTSNNRLVIFVQQLQEIGTSTESSIKAIAQPKRNSNNEGPTFKYYCPICMLYFKASGKITLSPDSDAIPDILPCLPCPYCTQEPFQLLHPKKSEPTRSYRDEVGGSKKVKTRSASLKIGDSFEDMKKKMIMFEDTDRGTSLSERDNNELRIPSSPSPAFIHSSLNPQSRRHDENWNIEDSPSAAPSSKHILPPIRRLDFNFPNDNIVSSIRDSASASQAHESGLVPSLPNTPHDIIRGAEDAPN